MTYPQELRRALAARGICGRRADRIVLEIEDHLSCDADAELGDPLELAQEFADELGAGLARRSAVVSFAALALAAPLLVAPQLLAQTYPDLTSGRSVAIAALALIATAVAPQVAFVAGSLALLRALRLRRRRVLPAAEITLLRRRAAAGLAAGLVTAAGPALYAWNFWSQLPRWWAVLTVSLAAAVVPVLAAGGVAVARAGLPVVAVAGPAGDLLDDFAPLRAAAERLGLREHPWRLAALVGGAVTLAALAVGWQAERSFVEGVFRAGVEAIAFAVCFAALGRFLGLRGR